ncbi:MAG: hypothetical protein AAGB51_08785 [Planctomycetota bacterium]
MTRARAAAAAVILAAGGAAAQPLVNQGNEGQGFAEAPLPRAWLAPKDNAALTYLRLFMVQPGFMEDFGDQEITPTAVLSDELVEKFASDDVQAWITELLIATELPYCDFGIRLDMGWNTLLPHLGHLRRSARALILDTNRLLESDRPSAFRRLGAVFALARHVCASSDGGGVLIETLVGSAVFSAAAGAVSDLDSNDKITPDEARALLAKLADYDPSDPFGYAASIERERAFVVASIDAVIDLDKPGLALAEDYASATSSTVGVYEGLAALDREGLRDELRRYEEAYEILRAAWGSNDPRAKLENLESLVADGHFGVVSSVFWPSFSRILDSRETIESTLVDVRGKLERIVSGE